MYYLDILRRIIKNGLCWTQFDRSRQGRPSGLQGYSSLPVVTEPGTAWGHEVTRIQSPLALQPFQLPGILLSVA